MSDDAGFTADQAVAAQRALRRALGLGEERFPLAAFVGMISDEIEQMRAAGRSDQDVSELIARATGQHIDPAEIARHYAPPEDRRQSG